MKFKKILSGVLASAMLLSAMPSFSSIAADYDKDTTGNTMLAAEEVNFGEVASGKIEYFDNDWFKFTVPSTGMISVAIGANTSADYEMVGGDAESTSYGTEVFGDGTQVLTYYLTAGDYYIHLSYRGYGNYPNYDLRVKATPHNYCRTDAQSDFSSDCIKTTQAYCRMSRSFCVI